MKKYLLLLAAAASLAACSSVKTPYTLQAYSNNGTLLSGRVGMKTNEAGLETARDTLCRTYPRAKIVTTHSVTKAEVSQFSPYQCR